MPLHQDRDMPYCKKHIELKIVFDLEPHNFDDIEWARGQNGEENPITLSSENTHFDDGHPSLYPRPSSAAKNEKRSLQCFWMEAEEAEIQDGKHEA